MNATFAPAPTPSRRAHGIACAALAIVFVAFCSGCRSIAPGRMLDLGDCGTLGVGAGYGLDATVQAGALAEASLGIGHNIRYRGWNGHTSVTEWQNAQLSWPPSLFMSAMAMGMAQSDCCLLPPETFYAVPDPERMGAPPRPGNRTPAGTESKHFGYALPLLSEQGRRRTGTFHNATRVEAEATLCVVSVRAGLNPLEILDFLLGFLGFDIAGDDPPRGEEEEKESHAESAENAEPFSVPNRLRLSGTDVPLRATNELAFAVEKGRLPCKFALDCRRLETGSLTVFCENGQAVFYPSNRIDVVTEGGIETIAAEHPVATLSFGEGVNHEKTLVVDPEGLRRRREPNIRTALRCKVAEDEKRYLVTIPIVLSHDCPPTNVTFQLLSNWYDY